MQTKSYTLVSCPFNPEHKMIESRLIWHIGRGCKDKKEKEHLFSICPYNALHIIKNEDFEIHKDNCPSKNRKIEDTLPQTDPYLAELREAIRSQDLSNISIKAWNDPDYDAPREYKKQFVTDWDGNQKIEPTLWLDENPSKEFEDLFGDSNSDVSCLTYQSEDQIEN